MSNQTRGYNEISVLDGRTAQNQWGHVKDGLGADYPQLTADDRRPPLSVWYAENAADVPAFETQMRRKVHYVIHPDYLWRSLIERARTQDAELLQTLERAFQHIENDSFASSFQGLFSEINLNSEKLGRTPAERNKKLCAILAKIAEGIAQFYTDSDILGDACEYLIGQFAAGSGPLLLNLKTAIGRPPGCVSRACSEIGQPGTTSQNSHSIPTSCNNAGRRAGRGLVVVAAITHECVSSSASIGFPSDGCMLCEAVSCGF